MKYHKPIVSTYGMSNLIELVGPVQAASVQFGVQQVPMNIVKAEKAEYWNIAQVHYKDNHKQIVSLKEIA